MLNNFINKIKQTLGLRMKSDIQEDLRQAKEEEAIAKPEYVEAEGILHDRVRLREEAEADYKSMLSSKKAACYKANRHPALIWYRVQCNVETKRVAEQELRLQEAIDNERVARNNMETKKQEYEKTIRRRKSLQEEWDNYKYPL